MSRTRSVVVCLLSSTVLSATGVLTSQPAVSAEGVEEIMVTARKREERLRDVPDSITALSAAAIEQSGVRTVKDVATLVPNLTIVETQQPGTELINIRGMGQIRNGEPPVAVIIDGVQLSSGYQFTQDLFDVERIEVLKGPQGAVYGRNAIGGAINIVTRKPGNEFEGFVKGSYGTGDDFRLSAAVSGPIVADKLMFRASGSLRDFDGDITNVLLNEKANGEESENFRLNLLGQLSEDISVDVRYSRMDLDAGAAWYSFVPPGGDINTVYPVAPNLLGQAERVLNDASIKIDVDLDAVTLTSITAYSKISSGVFEDFDFLPQDFFHAEQYLRQKSWSQELRLSSNGDGPLKWMVGGYYLDISKDLDSEIYIRPDAGDFVVPFPIPEPTLFSATRSSDDNKSYAAFAHASYRVMESLELAAALRYDIDDRQQFDRVTLETFNKKFKSWQPKFQASFFINEDAMVYASVGKGFRSGGFNANDRITRIFGAETNWNYELGTKLSGFDNRLLFNAAVFYTEVNDRQVYNLDILTAAQVITTPIEKADIKGVEADITARLLEGLDVQAAVGFMDTKIKRYDTSVYAGLPIAGDYTGNKLPQTPGYSYAFAVQYAFSPVDELTLTSRAEVNGNGGDYYWEIDNADKREAITLVNLRLSAEYRNFTLTGFVTNLFKEKYILEYVGQGFSGAPFGNYSLPAPDRRYGVEAQFRF
jgi:iron complex outermembrane receptor protein